jgi:hypothetical protein
VAHLSQLRLVQLAGNRPHKNQLAYGVHPALMQSEYDDARAWTGESYGDSMERYFHG